MSSKHNGNSAPVIPHYFLYGEPNRDVDQQFLHIETLESRSQKYEWEIRPHTHDDLHHLLFLGTGKATFVIEAESIDVVAPAIISVPPQCVHGFQFDPDCHGWIITSSIALLRRISQTHPEFEALLYHSAMLHLCVQQADQFAEKFAALVREFVDQQVARSAATESLFLSILVDAIRIKMKADQPVSSHHDSDVELVTRYKSLIEKHFRSRVGAAQYATRLCVCHESLRSACVRITGSSPLALLNARRLLEAKRCLLYSSMSVAEVAYQSGFEDPAYFSRFFARSTGKSPRDYRANHVK